MKRVAFGQPILDRACIWPIIGIVVLVTLAHGSDAGAQDDFRRLREQDIRTRVVGKEITDSSHWGSYLRPDGMLLSDEMGRKWTGIWKIRNDKLCMSNPGGANALDCYEVWMSGANIRLRADENGGTLDAVVEKHRKGD